jgi:hypothetical protein
MCVCVCVCSDDHRDNQWITPVAPSSLLLVETTGHIALPGQDMIPYGEHSPLPYSEAVDTLDLPSATPLTLAPSTYD